jgi:uncharacterized protein YqjF (DUF2071 family)
VSDEAALAVLAALAAAREADARQLSKFTGLGDALLAPVLQRLAAAGCIAAGGRLRLLPEGRRRLEEGIDELARAAGDRRTFVEPCPTVPLELRGTFREVFCLLYRLPAEALRARLPPLFEPLVERGSAWISLLFVSVAEVRPSWAPPPAGRCWYEVSVRAHVRFHDWSGRERGGIFFLASFMNSAWLAYLGSALREFKFHHFRISPVVMLEDGGQVVLSCEEEGEAGIVAVLECAAAADPSSLLGGPSPAQELIHAREAFAWCPEEECVYVLEIDGDPWVPQPARPLALYNGFFARHGLAEAAFDSAWRLRGIGVRWLPLKREHLRPRSCPETGEKTCK